MFTFDWYLIKKGMVEGALLRMLMSEASTSTYPVSKSCQKKAMQLIHKKNNKVNTYNEY